MKTDALNGWRAVEAVVRQNGLAAAAEELAVSRAAVASQIRGVEARLGYALFHRRPSGLEPTEELLRLTPRLTAAFGEIAAVQNAFASAASGRRLALTVTQIFAESWLPRQLPDFLSETPDVDLRIDTTLQVVSLDTGAFDFALRYMGEPGPELESVDLFPGGVALVCTPDVAKRYALDSSTTTLEGVPRIRISDPSTDPDLPDWAKWSEMTGIRLGPDSQPEVDYSQSIRSDRIARGGLGVVLGGLAACFHAVAEGELVLPLGRRTIMVSRYRHRLVWRKDRRLTRLQRRFRDFVSERAEQDRAEMRRAFGVS